MTDISGAVAASCCSLEEARTTRRDPDRRGTKPGRLTPKKWAETIGKSRASGMDERRLRRNREGRSEPPRLNRWRRRLAESKPSPGPAQPGRAAKPRPWPTGAGNRRPTRRGGGSVLRGCRAAMLSYASFADNATGVPDTESINISLIVTKYWT